MNIKYKNKERLAKYILEHNGVEVDPHSIFDIRLRDFMSTNVSF